MHNLYEQFRQLIPDPPLQAGTVIDVGSGVVTVALPGGGRIKTRGSAALGQKVFVRDDAIEGIAPTVARPADAPGADRSVPGALDGHDPRRVDA